MKKILFIIAMLLSFTGMAQTVGQLRYDTVKMYKIGGTTELILQNASSGVVGGVLRNVINGRTVFQTVVDTVFKNATADSFVYYIGGVRRAFKDSSGTGTYARDTIVAGRGLTATTISANKVQLDNDSAIYIVRQLNDTTLEFTHYDGRIDTAVIVSGGGGGSGSPFGYVFSTTAPTDTSKAWVNTNYNFLECFPVQYHVNGQWNAIDTVGGEFYDNIGKVLTRGYPYIIIGSGQSNIVGPYYDGDEATCHYYQGDTLPARSVAAWDFTTGSSGWKVGQIRNTPFAPASGANYLLLLGKKISKETGRSVRILINYKGGTQLDYWAGPPGGRPDTAAGYRELTMRMDSAKIKHPDLYVWAQSEAGSSVADSFYVMWVRMIDSLRHQKYLDSTTMVLSMASGLAEHGLQLSGSGGDGYLRLTQYDNDRFTKYIDRIGEISPSIHLIPAEHERTAIKMWHSILEGPVNPINVMTGYNPGSALPSPFSLVANPRKLVGVGLNFTNVKGDPFISLTNKLPSYGDADSSIGGSNLAKLQFNNSANSVSLFHYSGKNVSLDGTNFNLGTNEMAIGNGYPIKWGGNPAILGYDPGGAPALYFYTNYSSTIPKMFLSTSGLSVLKGALPSDSALDITGGIHVTRGLRASGLPSNQTYFKSLGVTSDGTFYLKDTLAVSGVYAPLNSPSLITPALGTPVSGNFSTGTFTWPTFNQNTTGSAATLTTARNIWGQSFNGSAAVDGAFTQALSANTVGITSTGYSLTGSNASSLIDLAGTWNTSGNPTAIKLNVTNTASGASANLMDLQIGGVSLAKVDKNGTLTLSIGSVAAFNGNFSGFVRAAAADYVGWNGRSRFYSSSTTAIEARNSTNADYASVQSLYDRFGSGTPEGAVTAPVGAVYHRTDGGAGTSFYVKESGTGNTGWVAK